MLVIRIVSPEAPSPRRRTSTFNCYGERTKIGTGAHSAQCRGA
jgi:hypothetical protein